MRGVQIYQAARTSTLTTLTSEKQEAMAGIVLLTVQRQRGKVEQFTISKFRKFIVRKNG